MLHSKEKLESEYCSISSAERSTAKKKKGKKVLITLFLSSSVWTSLAGKPKLPKLHPSWQYKFLANSWPLPFISREKRCQHYEVKGKFLLPIKIENHKDVHTVQILMSSLRMKHTFNYHHIIWSMVIEWNIHFSISFIYSYRPRTQNESNDDEITCRVTTPS